MPACDHSKTKLACIDCSCLICPKCFVQCAVGNRCPKCAGRFESHVMKLSPAVFTRLVVVAMASGVVLANLVTMQGAFGGFLFQIFVGYLLGRIIHRAADYKFGPKIAPIAVGSCLLGMLLNHNITLLLFLYIYVPQSAGVLAGHYLTGILLGIVGICIPLMTTVRTR